MRGVEGNGDIVDMGRYGGLFGDVEGWEWGGEMIWFDKLN